MGAEEKMPKDVQRCMRFNSSAESWRSPSDICHEDRGAPGQEIWRTKPCTPAQISCQPDLRNGICVASSLSKFVSFLGKKAIASGQGIFAEGAYAADFGNEV
jgi:hypothetical protein